MHAGLSVGPDGATHQMLEDLAILMQIIAGHDPEDPGSAKVARAATKTVRP